MKRLLTIGRIVLLTLLMATSFSVEAQHYVTLDGTIDSLVVLPRLGADTSYLVNNALIVTDGGDLRIEAGAKVYFGQSAYLRVDGGKLKMNGTATDSIYLSCQEFSHDWAGIQLKNATEEDSIRMSYVSVVGALSALNASNCLDVSINHCSFNNYYAGKGLELTDCSNFLIDSCFFYNCVSGIELKARTTHSKNNLISHSIFDQGQINIEVSNVGYGYKCHNTVITDNCFEGATTAISFESVGGLSDMDAKNFILNNLISSSLPEGGSGYTSYGIKAAMDSLVIRNNIFWKNDEAITMLRVCHLVVEHNTFYDNGLVLTNLLASGSACFTENTISEAQKRIISYPSGLSRMNGNNFLYFNKNITLFANVSAEDVDMRGNFWNNATTTEIDGVIIDKKDSPALGEIVYEDYLTECEENAPVSPPFRVKKQFVDGQWLISWDGNPEGDFDHYVLFYDDFQYYKFSKHIDSIFSTSMLLSAPDAENVAVAACDHHYDFNVYAREGQSAYAFATYYPYAGADGYICASTSGYLVEDANIPYMYNRFVWRTSGTGVFSDSLSLQPTYYPSEEDYESGEITLTLRVVSQGVTKTDALQLRLAQPVELFAGNDYYSGLNRPISLDEAWAINQDSITWHSLGDGQFDNPLDLNTIYYPGELDKTQGFAELVLEGWSPCGSATDTIRFDLYEEFSLEGRTWSRGLPCADIQVLAVALNDGNPFLSGFYRTHSDNDGHFIFNELLPDTYILYAFPDTLDSQLGGAYYLGDFQWNESNMIRVDGNVYDVDFELPTVLQGFTMGEGSISGVFDFPETGFRADDFYCQSWLQETGDVEYCNGGLSNVGVLLLDEAKQHILGFALTDASGAFNFNALPLGTYHVMADLPRYGRGMVEELTLSPQQPIVTDLHLYINDRGKVAMYHGNLVSDDIELSVFPNPTASQLNISGLESLGNYSITITDILGNVVLSASRIQADLLGEVIIEVCSWSKGLYFLHVTGASMDKTMKFVKI